MSAADPTQRQHRIHRKGAIGDLIRADEDYLRTGITENDTRIIWRAMMLTPKVEVCDALLKGQKVPKSALDPLWRKRYRL